jgi:hypothetical protein
LVFQLLLRESIHEPLKKDNPLSEQDLPEGDEQVIRGILQYLIEHPDAKDTAEGIAKWWLAGTDAESKKKQVQNALDCLTARGWLTKRETSRREKIYGLNRNLLPEIRGFLRIQGTLAH